MNNSRKSRRSQRHQKLRRGAVQLNLVSMIDVFAVLVFFLLVSSSLSAARLNVIALNLPSPDVSVKPDPEQQRLTVTVTVNKSGIEVTGRNGASRALANTPDGYNYLALSELLVQEKRSAPAKKDLTLLLAADIIYDEVVQLMDTARLTPAEARAAGLPAELFPQITIGDAPGAQP